MMLTIHGLPLSTKYQDVKILIKQECRLTDFILDNLVSDGDGIKKVRIGVADEAEGSQLMKCLNGYRMSGKILRVEPVGKASINTQGGYDMRPNFQPNNDYNQVNNYGNRLDQMGGPTVWSVNQPQSWVQNQHVANNAPGFNFQQSGPDPYAQQVATPYPQSSLNQRELMLQGSRGIQEHGYQGAPGVMQPKTLMPTPASKPRVETRSNALRSVEISETPNRGQNPSRYPNQGFDQQKPITIMKDNFQGPSQLGREIVSTQGQYAQQTHAQPQPWQQQGQPQHFDKSNQRYEDMRKFSHDKPSGIMNTSQMADRGRDNYKDYEKAREFSPDRRSPMRRRMSPRKMSPQPHRMNQDHRMSQHGRMSPPGRRSSPSGRRMSPSDRRISPSQRMVSPDRKISQARRMSPSGRLVHSSGRVSPSGRRMSPPNRMVISSGRRSPSDRRSPLGRMIPSSGGRGSQMSPPGRRLSPTGRMMPTGGRMSPSGRRMPSPGRRLSPSGRMITPGGRVSPSGRRMSPPVRRMSPSGKIITPSGGRVSPPGKRMSPSGGRRISPSGGRLMSPSARRMSPSVRRISPGGRHTLITSRRDSPRRSPPAGRQMSPSRVSDARYSPSRHHADKPDKFGDSGRQPMKLVRPAYEPETKAPSQAMYSGGYRPNVHGTGQYSMGDPQGEQRNSPWQDREKTYPNQKKEEDRRDRMQMSRGSDRGLEHDELQRVSPRASRSPTRRDRSPRDRYRRHSPSPRSPRRSWALEKRRSPTSHEAPPPPSWPGQGLPEDHFTRQNRSNFPEKHVKEEKIKNTPVWEAAFIREKHEESRDRRAVPEHDNEIRIRRDLGARDMGPSAESEPSPRRNYKLHEDRIPPKFERQAPKFERNNFPPERHENFSRAEPERSKYIDREAFLERSERHANFDNEKPSRRQEARVDTYKKSENFDKEFEDIYKRAIEFSKKTQELRKFDRKREERADKGGRREHREEPRDILPEDDYKREPQWVANFKYLLRHDVKEKRDKASAEIARRIILKHTNEIESTELRNSIEESLKETTFQLLFELFQEKDVSYIECIIKFNSRFDARDEDKIFYDARAKLSSQFRGVKRSAPDASEIPSKSFRRSPEHNLKLDDYKASTSNSNITGWKADFGNETPALYVNVPPPVLMAHLPFGGVDFVPTFEQVPQEQLYQPPTPAFSNHLVLPPVNDGTFHLYLCKDDFRAFNENEMQELKKYLVSEIFQATESSNHAPSFIFKGLQTPFRYELVTDDPESRDWLINLDFRNFIFFNVIVYANDELWYERAAIWLPGHSKCRNIDPLTKLRLQNQHLKQIEMDKWKFVKKIVTKKGTRMYVDLPPSSARSLEGVKTLSYELQQVNFFLRALAVDKDAFDAGLNEASLDPSSLMSAVQSSIMPTLKEKEDKRTVLITLKSKSLSVVEARKIKEIIIYLLFKYLKAGGKSKTDFVKFGYITPCYFGIIPANNESMKWLMTLDMGKLNKQPIVVVGSQEKSKYFKMSAQIPHHCAHINTTMCLQTILQYIKVANKGVKGINFVMWNGTEVKKIKDDTVIYLEIDVESIITLAGMNFLLDYIEVDSGTEMSTIRFVPHLLSLKEMMEKVNEYNAEQTDSHVVADMDIASSESEDIIFMGEVDDNRC